MSDRVVEKRLSAILAADVAGYTVLMEQDSDGTVAAWRAAREETIDPTIKEYSGRIVKHTGDGFLAEFPTIQDAVGCAITMQEGLATSPLNFRMGVNLGDIIDDGDDIHGEGVNIAARIEGLAESGGICISGSVHEQVRHRLGYRFDDMGEIKVKNVSEPVRVIRVLIGEEVATTSRRWPPPKYWKTGVALLLLVAVASGTVVWWQLEAPVSQPDASMEQSEAPSEQIEIPMERTVAQSTKASIAVLPFVNISGDDEQEYFSDGMTEDLVTDLSKILNLTVISRTSTSGYKGAKIDIREVGKTLNVRYVIEGSVRKVGERVRINAQLVDATTGGHLWAERYDGDLKDIFGLQDQVLEKIVGSLELELSGEERRRLAKKGTDSVAAHDLYLRGLFAESDFTREGSRDAMRLYEQALSIDPDYALAYTRIANILELSARNGWSTDVQADLTKAVKLAEKAISLDPRDPKIHWSLGRATARLRTPGALERGIEALQRAIDLDPNFADAYAFLAVLYIADGRADDGLRSVETAMRLNPSYPSWYLYMRGMARYVTKDYETAIVDFEEAAERSPSALFVRWWLAASYAQTGQKEDAEWQFEEMQMLGFEGSIATIMETRVIQDPGYLSIYKEGLRKAGIPE